MKEHASAQWQTRHRRHEEQIVAFLLLFLGGFLFAAGAQPAAKPLFRDPVHDGAADPSVIWNPLEKKWFMFYTNRRANMTNLPGFQRD